MLNRIMIEKHFISETMTITSRDRTCRAFCLFLQMQSSPITIRALSENILEVVNGLREEYMEREEHHRIVVRPDLVELELWLSPGMDPEDTHGIMPTLEWYGYLGKWLADYAVMEAWKNVSLLPVPSGEIPHPAFKELCLVEHMRRADRFRCVLSKSLHDAVQYVIEHECGQSSEAVRKDTYAVITMELFCEGGENGTMPGVTFRETKFCKGVLELLPDPEAGQGRFTANHAEQVMNFVQEHKDVDTLLLYGSDLLAAYLVLLLEGDVSPFAPKMITGRRPNYTGVTKDVQTEAEAALRRRGIHIPENREEAGVRW